MNRRFKFTLSLVCMLAGSAVAASAAVTSWSQTEGGRMRMAALSDGDRKITAIVEIEPSAGWKTYWRDPGDAGMPPDIKLADGGNLRLLKVSYPTPEIGRDEGGRFFGYHGPVSLVLELERPDPSQSSELNANVLVGLCKDICVPFQAAFSLPLGDVSHPKSDEFMKIQMARANLPETPSDDFKVADAVVSPDKAFIEVTIVSPGDETPELAVAPSSGVLLGSKPDITRKDGKTFVRYAVRRLPSPLKDTSVTLLVKAVGRAIETTLAIH